MQLQKIYCFQYLNQVFSILPELGFPPPLNCSRRRQNTSRTFMFFLGVVPVVALDSTPVGVCGQSCSKGGNPTNVPGLHSDNGNGASLLIILFIYFDKCETCEINRHHHKASKSDFANIEFQWKCSSVSVNERDNS